MTTAGKFAAVSKSELSKKLAANDNAAANEQEVEEKIEEDTVEKEARENRTDARLPFMSNKQRETADDAVASREEIEEQAVESRIDKVAFEDGVSTTSAKEYIHSGRAHE